MDEKMLHLDLTERLGYDYFDTTTEVCDTF